MKRIAILGLLVLVGFTSRSILFAQQGLDEKTKNALIEAINDEYKARALYQKVIDRFGSVRPFSNIIKAESTHVAELIPLFKKYGIAVPEDSWYKKVPSFNTTQEACAAGVQAEIDNVKMYDGFLKFVREDDIRDVFKRLQAASLEKHLPAFKRCAESGSGRGRGRQD